jgi:Fe-S oxidoreductase
MDCRIGDRRGLEKYRDQNIEIFNRLGVKTIITSWPGCTSTFKEEYAGKLNCEVRHAVEYFDRLISQGKIRPKNRLTGFQKVD